MVGTFSNVRKSLSCYCFIDGADGNSYFCHREQLKDKRDWKFVWNGNECSFKIKENPDADKKDIAVEIIPLPKVNPDSEKRERVHKEKNRKGKQWNKPVTENLYYVLTYKKLGTDNPYAIVTPATAWKDKTMAEENLFFHEAEKGDINSYRLKRALIYRDGSDYVVKEFLPRNKAGDTLYKGGIKWGSITKF